MGGSPFFVNHPDWPVGERSKVIPIGIHGDGGSFAYRDQIYILSWNSLRGGGPSVAQRFLFTVIRDFCVETLDSFFEILAW